MPSAQTNDKVTVSAKSLEDVLEALQAVAAALVARTADDPGGGGNGSGGGSTTTATRQPTEVQSRAILDYLALNQLLTKVGFEGRIVCADRVCDVIKLRDVPTVATQALVTPGGGGVAQRVPLEEDDDRPDDPTARQATVVGIREQPIIRIELQDVDGVPVALGPRLPPVANPGGCDGTDVDVRARRSR